MRPSRTRDAGSSHQDCGAVADYRKFGFIRGTAGKIRDGAKELVRSL